MIPFTFPSRTEHGGVSRCVCYPLSSVSGLKAWIDYTPVKLVSDSTGEGNTYNHSGCQLITELPSVTGLQSFVDYIPIYYDNSLTKRWSTDVGGYIPVATESYGYGMTSSGDYFSTPNAAANRITGNITLIVEAALDDWTPAAVDVLVAKDSVSSGGRSYSLNVQTSGNLRFNYSLDGDTIISITSSVATSFIDGKKYHVAVERESATGKVRFYTSTDGKVFTQLGTEQTGTSGSIFAGNAVVQFGNLSSLSYALKGKIYDSEGYAGLYITDKANAVMKFDFDPFDWVSGTSFTGRETGEVWTLNGSVTIYK